MGLTNQLMHQQMVMNHMQHPCISGTICGLHHLHICCSFGRRNQFVCCICCSSFQSIEYLVIMIIKNEYLVIMSLSSADACNMMAFFTAGVRRFYLVYKGEHNVLMSPWQCSLVFHNLIWSFTDILSGLILLMVSVECLLSIAYPLRYLTWSTMYVKALFGSAFIYSLVTGTVISLVYVYTSEDQENRMRSALCFGIVNLFGQKINYIYYRKYAGVVFSFLNIVAYGLIWILYNQHQSRVAADQVGDNQKKRRLFKQRRLTQSLGISCLCTIFVYMVPFGVAVFLVDILSNHIRLWLFIVTLLNPLFNVIIYYYRHPEMKQAFKALFTGKIMPDALSAWKANTKARRTPARKPQVRHAKV